jgi:PAS domain S-box-containing protein
VMDTDLAGDPVMLFDRLTELDARDPMGSAWHRQEQTIAFAGRELRLYFASTPAFEAANGGERARWSTAFALLGGTLLMLLVANMLAARRSAFDRAEGMASSLRRSEAEVSKLALVASKTDNSVIITDASGAIEWVNDGFVRLTGYAPAEVTGRKPGSFLQGPETDPAQVSMMRAHIQALKPFTAEVVNYRKDGSTFWVVIEAQPVIDSSGALRNYIAIARDMTERNRVYLQMRKAYDETESLLSSISAVLVSVMDDDRIVRWNQAAERVFDRTAAQVIGTNIRDCPVAWDLQSIQALLAQGRTGEAPAHASDVRYWRSDGTEGVIEMGCSITRNDQGDHQMTLVGLDVTGRRLMQSHLNQAMKLESIGQLAAGVAHEINTPTQFVGDNLHFLQEGFMSLMRVLAAQAAAVDGARNARCTPELLAATSAAVESADLDYLLAEVPKAIAQSLDGVKRVADIVGALKAFSHPDEGDRKSVDLGKALQSTLVVARNEYKYVADVVTDLKPDLPLVPCLPGEINQVFLNLIVNAAHAISDAVRGTLRRGTITVTTARVDDWIEVRIADTGIGIPQAIRARIFDPFFTTKEVGRGTGQGLYIARDIVVSKHGGSVTFESEVGVGTTFIIRLPIQETRDDDAKRQSALHLAIQAPGTRIADIRESSAR